MTMNRSLPRRALLGGGMALAVAPALPALAAELPPTPAQTAGPFYPAGWTGEADNDLVRVANAAAAAAGQVTHVFGRVTDPAGRPLAGVAVEIWQADAEGRYHYPQAGASGADPGFQGYGRTLAAADGGYRFRTLKPAPYPGRTAHIHFRLSGAGLRPFTTQMYFAGEPLNERDGLLRRTDPAARQRLLVALKPAPELEAAALAGRFDIVLAG